MTYCRTCTQRQDQQIEDKYKELGAKRIEEEKKKEKRYIYVGETNRSEDNKEHKNSL